MQQEIADIQVVYIIADWRSERNDASSVVVRVVAFLVLAGFQIIVVEVTDFRFNSGCAWKIIIDAAMTTESISSTTTTTTAAAERTSGTRVVIVIGKSPGSTGLSTFLRCRALPLNFDYIFFHAGKNCIAEHSCRKGLLK